MGRRLAWRLGPSRMGRRLGLAARRLGSRLGWRMGRRLLELRWGWGGGWGWGYDPGWAIAAATVPLGVAIAANAAQPVYGGSGCWVRRRVWTSGGHYLGRRLVNMCN